MAALTDSRVIDDVTFPAMGNTARVTVIATNASHVAELLSKSRTWIASLEASWSRFIPASDIFRLNTAGGRSVRISPDTEVLVRHLLAAYRVTDGVFNPFILPSLISAGYGRSLADDGRVSCSAVQPTHAPTADDVLLESVDGATWCRLLGGATLDPGGLGKGLAADIVAERLMLEGAVGVLVSVGGDIRCAGDAPDDGVWVIDIEAMTHPAFGDARIALRSGAIATSSVHAKRWHGGHHVIDPSTGCPLDATAHGALTQASVIASNAVWAEVFATAALVVGRPLAGAMIESRGLAARFETTTGRPVTTTRFDSFDATQGAAL